MKASASIIGIILIILGVLAFVYQGITYTTREEVADIGPVEIQTQEEKTIPLPPVFGGVALIGGVALVIAGTRKP